MRAIIHLGTYKTGTSSVQNMLYDNYDFLLKNGVLYPRTGIVPERVVGMRHRKLTDAYRHGEGSEAAELLMAEFRNSGAHTMVLSTEAWSSPQNLKALADMVDDLRNFGVETVEGVVAFRNIATYQVSHYREYTVVRKNRQDFSRYISARQKEFDYLQKLTVFREIFKEQLSVLDYANIRDARVDVLKAARLSNLLDGISFGELSNTKSVDALDVEAIRVARLYGLEPSAWRAAVEKLRKQDKSFATTAWTERFDGDVIPRDSAYIDAFQKMSGWGLDQVKTLFDPLEVKGRHVGEATRELKRALGVGRVAVLLQALRRRSTLRKKLKAFVSRRR